MSLAEFKKRQTTLTNTAPNPASATGATTSQMPPTARPPLVRPKTHPPTPGILPAGIRIIHPPRIQPTIQPAPNPTPPAPAPPQPIVASSVQQTSHNNYEIHSQHVLNNRAGQDIADRDRNSAKMLVILASGEQRLITFTLPRESCTVQDLLEQVGVQFDNTTTIQCVEHRGANVDFVVTVGFSVNESASELISRAEESLQMNRQQEQQQQQQQQQSAGTTSSSAGVSTSTSNASTSNAAPSSSTTNYNQANAAAEQVKRDAAATSSPASSSATVVTTAEGRKLIDGYYAVCQLCGFTGMDHAKCERCKRVFQEPPKRKSYMTKSSAASPASASSSNSSNSASEPPVAGDKKRELATTAGQVARFGKALGVNYPGGAATGTVGVRGRGGLAMRGNRTRGGRRVAAVAEVDPVVLLSSEDEADNEDTGTNESETLSANQSKRISSASEWPASFGCDSMLPEIDEEPLYKGKSKSFPPTTRHHGALLFNTRHIEREEEEPKA
ncbi:uncharacterized protein Dwil_GK27566 [Drosophila willistoni]|uniref:Uncharacterized protein n=1 Tax=Drosophila willistoni TaxID=7260 RepID=A0A0Q9X2D8_DROWI|nr:uncharacterized protein Dwil_GK27566 [Drosophila willistoni]